MGERRGTKGLELWCRRITDGYSGVSVQNMTTSWRDGLAFCAMIHHFRPDLIDFSSLNKDDIYRNNELAFRTAEQHLGIPALLDAEDMTSCSVPDRLSILTYLSQFYQVFAGSTSNRVIHSRASESSNDRIGSVTETPQSKVRSRSGMCKELLCVCCGLPVFLTEKLVIARSIYHRNCFRCKRCCLQLTSDNYHESDGGTYCDACLINKTPVMIRLEAPLSDEEKSKQFNFKHEQQQLHHGVEKDNNVDSKFDHMIRIINNKIDEFTSEREKSEEQMASPIVKNKREPRDNDAYVIVECRRASDGRDLAMSKWQTSSDPRTNNQKRFNEYITEDPSVIKELTKRLSLVHYHPKNCEEEPKLKSDHNPDVMTLPRVNSQQIQEPYLTSKDNYLKNINPFALSNIEEAEVYSKYETQNIECSTNPFDTTNEEMILEETKQYLKAVKTSKIKRLLEAPQINLNPFWNDNEEQKNNLDSKPELKNKSPSILKPRIIRKKKTAPLPPIHNQNDGITNNDPIPTLSPRITFRARKNKSAPVPPVVPKTASMPTNESTYRYKNDALFNELLSSKQFDSDEIDRHQYWNEEKLNKDEVNRNRQNLFCSPSSTYLLNSFEKNIESKCKRKKSIAPTPPMPIRRKIKVISMKDVKIELDQIEIQQQGLKKQGIQLEQIIRNKCESGNTKKDMSLEFVIEELILELFTLVNEKNELFRRQAELILLRRQQRLEEEHADIEDQVRCLIRQPEATKTDFDKQQEEILIQRLMKIVEKRNEIVECLEMDRKREIEEDQSIYREIDLYAARSKADNIHLTNEPLHSLKLKKGKFIEKKSNRNNKKDVDKDIDQSEMKLKRYNLRKWFYEYL